MTGEARVAAQSAGVRFGDELTGTEPGPATGGPVIRSGAAKAVPVSPAGRIQYLDGWRGLSILIVLLGHFLPHRFSDVANEGVEFFFVLSGRLMAEILFVDQIALPKFYQRRLSRVYPAMFVFVALTFVAMHWTTLAYKPLAAVMALTFTVNYGLALVHGVPAIDNLWSLCIEEHAYLILGLIAFLARRRTMRPAVVIAVLGALSALDGAISSGVLHQTYFQTYWRTDARLASIFFSAAAYLFLKDRPLPAWTPALALAGAVGFAFTPIWLHYSLGTLCLAVTICTLPRVPARVLKALSVPVLTTLGLWSYSIYLWQQPFYRLHLAGQLSTWAAMVLALGMAIASFRFVEQPARQWLNARFSRRRSVAAAEAAAIA
jgi:peptidoglycan/LPS O-acetylase OafA/YrhL